MIIEFILIYTVYLLVMIISSYYVNLFLSKDEYSKDELKNILPYFLNLWKKISDLYSIALTMVAFSVSSLLGIMIPFLFYHWIINSALVFAILFFLFPFLSSNFEKTHVNATDSYSDTAANLFVKYYNIILTGYGTGTGAILIYNWGTMKNVHFLWFFLNICIVSVLLGIALRNVLNTK